METNIFLMPHRVTVNGASVWMAEACLFLPPDPPVVSGQQCHFSESSLVSLVLT